MLTSDGKNFNDFLRINFRNFRQKFVKKNLSHAKLEGGVAHYPTPLKYATAEKDMGGTALKGRREAGK